MLATAETQELIGLRAALALAELTLAVPGLLMLAATERGLQATLALKPIPLRAASVSLVAAAFLWLGSFGLLELQNALAPLPFEYLDRFRHLHQALRPQGALDALGSLLAVAIAPAVGEELLLRGLVLPSLVAPLRPAGAVVLSALLFGLMHLDPYRFPFTFALGLALGWMRLRSGSLLPPLLAHAAVNAFTFGAGLLADPSAGALEARPLLGAALLATGALASVVAIRHVVDSPGEPT